ncbi:GLUTAMIC ACID-RICH PROTEIN-LIKE [Salix purpurea]|uniref:GLUTAMIC ACID-RICH PROTEIN-LIKE n=1 Tax=Salix purpurea TaxID=77065 RepID=A0A9Q0Z3H4_SALPP|nr:GLUTAMIC ACID-RICH PROTEIN-LIKE [Salix purpurea]
MENKKRSVLDDVSSFLLVEGSADSEAEYGILKLYLDVTAACDEADDDDDDDDDAESCSCDAADCVHGFDETFEVDHDDHREPSWSTGRRMFLKDAALDCMIMDEGGEEESKADIDLTREVMDAMEDRLFWETCIALGYP